MKTSLVMSFPNNFSRKLIDVYPLINKAWSLKTTKHLPDFDQLAIGLEDTPSRFAPSRIDLSYVRGPMFDIQEGPPSRVEMTKLHDLAAYCPIDGSNPSSGLISSNATFWGRGPPVNSCIRCDMHRAHHELHYGCIMHSGQYWLLMHIVVVQHFYHLAMRGHYRSYLTSTRSHRCMAIGLHTMGAPPLSYTTP